MASAYWGAEAQWKCSGGRTLRLLGHNETPATICHWKLVKNHQAHLNPTGTGLIFTGTLDQAKEIQRQHPGYSLERV